MPNILHISPDFNNACGVSRYVYQLLEHFSNKEKYKIYFITCGGDAIENLNKIGIEPHIIKFTKGWKNIFNVKSNIRVISKFCQDKKIDIIHTHHRYPEFIAYQVSKNISIKTVLTAHSIVTGLRRLSYRSDKIIAVSESVKSHLIKNYGVSTSKILMLRNFVDPVFSKKEYDKTLIRSELNLENNEMILFFAGRICNDKGIDILLKAFEILCKSRCDITLLLVGDLNPYFKNKYWPKNDEKIKLLKPDKDIDQYYSVVDIVILPSRVDPFPFVMLESGLYKLPFIGGRTGGIKEFIHHMENGLLVNPGNVQDLVEKIEHLMKDESLRKHLGENLFKSVLPLTNELLFFSKIERIYEELINAE